MDLLHRPGLSALDVAPVARAPRSYLFVPAPDAHSGDLVTAKRVYDTADRVYKDGRGAPPLRLIAGRTHVTVGETMSEWSILPARLER